MKRIVFVSAVLMLMAAALLAIGCGGADSAGVERDPTTTQGAGDTGAKQTNEPSSSSEPTAAADFDFQGTAKEYVTALGAGDCGTAADIKGWTEPGRNRDITISNCESVTEVLRDLGNPNATSTREETHEDGTVSAWVTLDYSNGSQWEMLTTFREQQGQGWVLSTSAYGFTRRGD